MLFETKEAADKFIAWNADDMEAHTGRKPVRAYYCHYCNGWHVTKNGNDEFFKQKDEKNAEVAEAAVEQGGANTGYFNTSRKKSKRYINKSLQDFLHSARKNAKWKNIKKYKKRNGNRDNWKDD